MANWFYYDASGRKFGPVDGATLKQLALHGVVRPETVLETEAGQRGAAGTLQGLEFGAGTAPPPPPVQNNTPPAGFGAGASMPVPPPMPQAQNVPTPPQTQNSVSPPVSQYENPTLQSRNRLLARLEGVGGSVLEVYEEKVVIVRPATWTNVSLHGVKGDKTLYYSKMTGLQLKKQGVAVGYIQFTIPGGNESRGGVFDAVKDENTLAFAKRAFQPSPNPLAQAIHDYIESRILGHPSDPQRYFGSFDFTQKEKPAVYQSSRY